MEAYQEIRAQKLCRFECECNMLCRELFATEQQQQQQLRQQPAPGKSDCTGGERTARSKASDSAGAMKAAAEDASSARSSASTAAVAAAPAAAPAVAAPSAELVAMRQELRQSQESMAMMLEEFAKASKGPVEESLTISHEEMDTMRARLVAGRFEEWGAVPLEADDCVLYLEPAVSRAAQPPSIAVEMFLDGAGAETAAYRLLADLALWRQWDVLWASIRRVDSERPPHPASFLDVLHLLTAMPPNFLSARDLRGFKLRAGYCSRYAPGDGAALTASRLLTVQAVVALSGLCRGGGLQVCSLYYALPVPVRGAEYCSNDGPPFRIRAPHSSPRDLE